MKAGLAASMLAVAAAQGLAGDVVLAAVRRRRRRPVPWARKRAAHLGSPGGRCDRHRAYGARRRDRDKGFAGFEIETAGRAAHGSRPDRGIDAIARMGPVLVELSAIAERLRTGQRHRLLGPSSLHASLIEGGQEYSSYPARCVLTGEWRTLPGQSLEEVEVELRDVIARSRVAAELRLLFTGAAFEVDKDEEIVQLVHRHAGSSIVGVPYWADSALLATAGIPTVLFGPRGGGEHERVEWVELSSVERLRDVLMATANDYCGPAEQESE